MDRLYFKYLYVCLCLGPEISKKTLAQVFSCEFCEISKNTFFTEHLRTTASDSSFPPSDP